jgi:fumarate reductase subunit D
MTFAEIVARIISLVLNPLVALLIGVALIFFLWGVVQLISAGGDSGKHAEGISKITYGVIALFVMVAVWGLVGIVANTLGIGTSGVPNIVP